MGRLGAGAGILLFVALALAGGVSAWVVLSIPIANIAGFLGWSWLSACWRDRRRYVLLEHALLGAGLMVTVAVTGSARVDVVADAWTAGLALTLSIGRVGCLFMGCCHGRARREGVCYPWLPPWRLAKKWAPVRLFPLQAVEAVGLLVLALVGAILARTFQGWGAPVIAAGYATMRFELELWRGDQRRYIWRLSYSQWACLLVIATSAARPVVALSSMVVLLGIVIGQHRRLRAPAWSVASVVDLAAIEGAAVAAAAGTPVAVVGVCLEPDGHGGVRMVARTHLVDRDLALIVMLASARSSAERAVGDGA
jgi:Prolipoprotein diacylglyceryl transferase